MDISTIIIALVAYLTIMFLFNRMFEKLFKMLLVVVTVLFLIVMFYFMIK